jgi:hypothetical protein
LSSGRISFLTIIPFQTYARLQARFASGSTRSVDYRRFNLQQLAYLVKDNEQAIAEAIRADLGKGPFAAVMEDVSIHALPGPLADLPESRVDVKQLNEQLFSVLNEIALAVKRLPTWMRDEGRMWDAMLAFKFMRELSSQSEVGTIHLDPL